MREDELQHLVGRTIVSVVVHDRYSATLVDDHDQIWDIDATGYEVDDVTFERPTVGCSYSTEYLLTQRFPEHTQVFRKAFGA